MGIRFTPVITGVVLIVASVLKVTSRAEVSSVLSNFISPSWLQLSIVQYELFLGAWLLSGVSKPASKLVAIITFALFAIYTLQSILSGQPSCGCFGALPMKPWWTLGIDVILATGLTLGFFSGKLDKTEVLIDIVQFVLAMALTIGMWSIVVVYRYETTENAIALLRGQRLVIPSSKIDLGDVPVDSTTTGTIELMNRSGEVVKLAGGSTDCVCTMIEDLPMDIPAGETRSIRVRYKAPASAGKIQHIGTIYTNNSQQSAVEITIVGQAIAPGS
ncbi:MAG: MauE/DoxX family redox-associated membrane protein [Gemmataceae bacterium]